MTDKSAVIDALTTLPKKSTALLIGATDTGKTTLAADAVNAWLLHDRFPIAVIDTDIGQSEIGAPGVVGLGLLQNTQRRSVHIRSLSHVPYIAGEFVGATSPSSHASALSAAVLRIVTSDMLAGIQPDMVLIDTPGMVTGAGADFLRTLIAVVRPTTIVAIARGAELEPILRPTATISPGSSIIKLGVGSDVGRKSMDVRATRRTVRFLHHLHGAQPIAMRWEDIVFENTTLTYGEVLAPHELRFVGKTLGGICVYAERIVGGVLSAVMAEIPRPSMLGNVGALEQPLRVNRIIVTTTSRFDHLLCGLHSPRGDLLAIGLLTAMDFERRSLEVLTTVRHPGAVARLTMGYVRVRPDGREIGRIPPKEAL